jgi:hypothetical protein
LTSLRAEVDTHNEKHGVPGDYEQVVVYGGQSVTKQGADEPA